MSLIKEQNIITYLRANKNLQAIQLSTSSANFENRFKGNISSFFRALKNGLYSFQGLSNREFFKGFSGIYFSLEDLETVEIIIIYDPSIKPLNRIQIISRLKKLVGLDASIQIGSFEEFETKIRSILSVKSKTQTFGDYYLDKK